MNIGESYNELVEELSMWTCRKESIEDQINYLLNKNKPRELRGIDYTRTKVQNGNAILDFEESLINIAPMENKLKKIDELIEKLNGHKSKIEDRLKNAEGINYDIIYKKYVEGKSLRIIAEELSYSYSYLREKAAKLKI